MKNIKNGSSKAGYDQEEAYFYKRDQELIQEMKKKSHLQLIQGGKSDSPPTEALTQLPKGKGSGKKGRAA